MLIEPDDIEGEDHDLEDLVFDCHEFIVEVLRRSQPKYLSSAGESLLARLKPYVQDETLH